MPKGIQKKEEEISTDSSERLSDLGQLIGGITHNLKTPIMAIAGSARELNELIKEYQESVKVPEVTEEDFVEIGNDMNKWTAKILYYCSYMADVIDSVKGQVVQLSDSMTKSFSLIELIKRIEMLMDHELRSNNCVLNIINKVKDTSLEIEGEINNFIQILNNLIVNAIHSYDKGGGKIDFTICRNKDIIEFKIRDYGPGIPDNIKKKLFKEMITTKGSSGTGLGIYMSYLAVKGKFKGDMTFRTGPRGTVFNVFVSIKS